MAAIQEISARVGRVTGCGIAANLRKSYPKPLLYAVLAGIAVANIFNLGAMADALHLFVPGKSTVFVVGFGAASLTAILFIPYSTYVRYLKWGFPPALSMTSLFPNDNFAQLVWPSSSGESSNQRKLLTNSCDSNHRLGNCVYVIFPQGGWLHGTRFSTNRYQQARCRGRASWLQSRTNDSASRFRSDRSRPHRTNRLAI